MTRISPFQIIPTERAQLKAAALKDAQTCSLAGVDLVYGQHASMGAIYLIIPAFGDSILLSSNQLSRNVEA